MISGHRKGVTDGGHRCAPRLPQACQLQTEARGPHCVLCRGSHGFSRDLHPTATLTTLGLAFSPAQNRSPLLEKPSPPPLHRITWGNIFLIPLIWRELLYPWLLAGRGAQALATAQALGKGSRPGLAHRCQGDSLLGPWLHLLEAALSLCREGGTRGCWRHRAKSLPALRREKGGP